MDKQQPLALVLAIGLVLLQGCGGSENTHLLKTPQLDNAPGSADAMADTITDLPHVALPARQEDIVGVEVDPNLGASGSSDGPINDSVPQNKSIERVESSAESLLGLLPLSQLDESSDVGMKSQTSTVGSTDTSSQIELMDESESGDTDHAGQADEVQTAVTETIEEVAPAVVNRLAEKELETSNLDTPGSEQRYDGIEGAGLDTITDLLFLTGQSNAASLVTRYDADLDAPDQRVFAYTETGWQVADLHQFWDKGIPGNFSVDDPKRDPYNNIIFQVGKALAKTANRTVGIVMLTAPGEGISHWDYNGPFYTRMRERAIAALNEVPHKASFDAVVWMQGETDWLLHGTADPDIPDFESYQSDAYLHYYPRKLRGLIEAMRSDPWFGSNAQFICAETVKAKLNPHLMALNNDDDALTGCAVASDLAARENDPNGNHFSAESLRVLGQRIADIYLALLPQ